MIYEGSPMRGSLFLFRLKWIQEFSGVAAEAQDSGNAELLKNLPHLAQSSRLKGEIWQYVDIVYDPSIRSKW